MFKAVTRICSWRLKTRGNPQLGTGKNSTTYSQFLFQDSCSHLPLETDKNKENRVREQAKTARPTRNFRRFRVFSQKHALFKASDIPKSYNICGRRKNAEKKSRILQLYHLLDSKSKKHIGIRRSQGYTHMVSGPSGGHVWGPQWFPDGLGSVYLW